MIKNINSLRTVKQRKLFMDDIVNFLTNNKIEFDSNPYLFAFKNCVYDLKKSEFVKPQADFYITKTTGYDYIQSTENQF